MNQNLHAQLNALLADYQVFYQKLRGYHWTVKGPMFFALHAKFEELYDAAAERVDALAERLMALGGHPVATLRGQLEIARLREDGETKDAPSMVRNVHDDLEALQRSLRAAVEISGIDPATANLLEGIADEQEKTLWMLGAFLAG